MFSVMVILELLAQDHEAFFRDFESENMRFLILSPYAGARVATTVGTKIIKKLDHTMIFYGYGGDENEMISTFRLHHWIR